MPLFPMPAFLILFLVCLLCSCIGFKRFVWFMSVGYGFSAAAVGLAVLILSLIKKQQSGLFLVMCILLIVYGLRLGGFLLVRELRNKNYRAKIHEIRKDAEPALVLRILSWIALSAYYVCQTSALSYRFANGLSKKTGILFFFGVMISAAGIVIESLADAQKSAQKNLFPEMPAMRGLYRFSRCPNYFGEMLFWTGLFLSAFGGVKGKQWIVLLIGYVLIMTVMVLAAKTLEKRHLKNYGRKPEYHEYANKTPILIPFVPLFHLVDPEEEMADLARQARRKEKKEAEKTAVPAEKKTE